MTDPPPVPGRAIIPFADLTPASCAIIAETAAEAAAVFESWRMPIAKRTGLTQAMAHLKLVATCGEWGDTPEELARTARALIVAGDSILIAQCLRGEPVPAITEELVDALRGGLIELGRQGSGDLLAQYWFGVLLARAGLRPRVPPAGERRPDFVIAIDTLDVGVEHKRPASAQSAPDSLDAAAAQLRDYGKRHRTPGMIVMDLSKVLGLDALLGHPVRDSEPLRRTIGDVFLRRSAPLARRAETYTRSDKYDRIVALMFYARAYIWEAGPDGLVPVVTVWADNYVCRRACGGLLRDQAWRALEAIKGGLRDLGADRVRQIR